MSENCPNLVIPDPIRLMIVKDLNQIKLNVGGQKFETSADTLKKFESFFSHLLASDIPQKVDADNYILIDRDGTHFGKILNFMRYDAIDFEYNVAAAKAIRMEADFYQLQELIQKCDEFLTSPMANLSACERAVYTKEERDCMIATGKALVFLNIGTLISGISNHFSVEECDKAISTAVIQFMKLRRQFHHHFTFIFDCIPRTSISLEFYFNEFSVATVAFYNKYNRYAEDLSRIDAQILEATNLLTVKMLDKLTEIQQ